MIIKFNFSNFRSVKDLVEISFEASRSEDLEQYYVARPTPKLRLLKMAAIYGANASGKSNVALALDFLRNLILNPAGKKTDSIKYDRFAFDPVSSEGNSEFNLDFVHGGIRYDYHVVLNPNYIVKESLHYYQPNKAVVFTRVTNSKNNLSTITLGSKVKIAAEERRLLEANTLSNNTVVGGFLKTNIEFPELQATAVWFEQQLYRVIYPTTDLKGFTSAGIENGEILKSSVIEILQKADFNITNVTIGKSENDFEKTISSLKERNYSFTGDFFNTLDELNNYTKRVTFTHSLKSKDGQEMVNLSFDDQSLGTKRYYQFAGLLDLMIRKEKVVVIDEIEASLHPELLKHFLLVFLRNSNNSQLIFTTHQREFMRETDMLRNDIFHFTEKAEDGSTELFSFTDFNSGVIRKGSSLYNAYRIGKLGATPELDDAYIAVD